MHPGATWKRADFQIHTPRDPQWQGSPALAGGNEDAEKLRRDWASGFVIECINKGIHAIAITDHHDVCMVEYVADAIAHLPNNVPFRPWLFPGMEVTCSDAVQCIVLFDEATTPGAWRRLFGGHLQNIGEPDRDAGRNPQATECGKDIKAFIGSVTSDTTLKDCTIILPHASNDGAHKSMLRTGFAARFASLPFDGVYCDKEHDALDEGTLKKIYGQIPEWGTRRRGIIPTGDNRHANLGRLGSRPFWIRLGEPTAESLRQAVLADVARLSYDQPTLPSHRITEVVINSSLTGPDFRISLNDGFTALIGGRGSGKSSLLEYIRFALGRSAIDTQSDDENYRVRDQALVADTLKDGSVSVILERDGVQERWTRTGVDSETIMISGQDGKTTELPVSSAQQRFRERPASRFWRGAELAQVTTQMIHL